MFGRSRRILAGLAQVRPAEPVLVDHIRVYSGQTHIPLLSFSAASRFQSFGRPISAKVRGASVDRPLNEVLHLAFQIPRHEPGLVVRALPSDAAQHGRDGVRLPHRNARADPGTTRRIPTLVRHLRTATGRTTKMGVVGGKLKWFSSARSLGAPRPT